MQDPARQGNGGGHGSRHYARLYDAIVALRPRWHDPGHGKGAIKVVMTASGSDAPHLQPHHTNRQQKKDLEKRFKDPADSLRMVLVRDMRLTGFDAPCLTKAVQGYKPRPLGRCFLILDVVLQAFNRCSPC